MSVLQHRVSVFGDWYRKVGVLSYFPHFSNIYAKDIFMSTISILKSYNFHLHSSEITLVMKNLKK